MMWDPRIAKMRGGAFNCPTSVDNKGAEIFRTINEQETVVAPIKNIHERMSNGMTQRRTAGINGTSEYP